MMKKKKKKLDEAFDGSSPSSNSVSSLFFREDAIKRHENENQKTVDTSGSDDSAREVNETNKKKDRNGSGKRRKSAFLQSDSDEAELSEIFGTDEAEPVGIEDEEIGAEANEDKVNSFEDQCDDNSSNDEAVIGCEGKASEENTEVSLDGSIYDPAENEAETSDEIDSSDTEGNASDNELTLDDVPTADKAEPEDEDTPRVEENEAVTEESIEECSFSDESSEDREELLKDSEITDGIDEEDPNELAMMIARAILSDEGTDEGITAVNEVTDEQGKSEQDEGCVESEACVSTEAVVVEDHGNTEKASAVRQRRMSKQTHKEVKEADPRKKLSSGKKVLVMGDPNIPIDSNLPHRVFRRVAGNRRSMIFVCVCYTLFLSLLVVLLSVCTSNLLKIYDSADPNRVIEECIDYISGSRLYNDVVLGVGKYRTEYESEKDASGIVLDEIYSSSDKNFLRVSHGEDYASYDIYSGGVKIYNILLGKKAETSSIIGISFWEVRDISFYDDCLNEYKKSFLISAPANAVVKLNGIELSRDMIVDEDYKFFIGSVWESNIPSEARCVLYSVDGIFGEPNFTAVHEGEELEIYTDEGGAVHAKYPKDWVKDYTVSVPKGASLYVNGILATKISSAGSAPATPFEGEVEGMTDIYVIEGLFNDPVLNAYHDGISLGKADRNDDTFTFGFSDIMYNKAEISVPKGATVKVNGVLLNADNSTVTAIPFAEWSKEKMTIGSSMPSELRAFGFKLPEFEKYTVSMLYGKPTVEVFFNGNTYEPYETTADGKVSTFKYDFAKSSPSTLLERYAKSFAETYIKYVSEGCYGMRDDVDMRKNFYTNWINYLSYILPDTLCYDSALESYSDVEYRPNRPVGSESYVVKDMIKYSDEIYTCKVVCTIKAVGGEAEETYELDLTVIVSGGQFKVWMHDTIS